MGGAVTPHDGEVIFDLEKAKNDFTTLHKAIQSGNLNEAQKAYFELQSDFEQGSR